MEKHQANSLCIFQRMKLHSTVYFCFFELSVILTPPKGSLILLFFCFPLIQSYIFHTYYRLKLSSSMVLVAPRAICFPLVLRIQEKLCYHIALHETKWWYWIYMAFCDIPRLQIQIFRRRHLGYIATLNSVIEYKVWQMSKI